jgi:hypothetical protein
MSAMSAPQFPPARRRLRIAVYASLASVNVCLATVAPNQVPFIVAAVTFGLAAVVVMVRRDV